MLAHAQIKDVISFVKISEEETFEPKHSHIIITRTCTCRKENEGINWTRLSTQNKTH